MTMTSHHSPTDLMATSNPVTSARIYALIFELAYDTRHFLVTKKGKDSLK